MKKIAIFFVIIVFIVVAMFYLYMNYTNNYYNIKKENQQFESYYQEETYGTNLASIINKAIDNNEKNKIEKDQKGKYIENDTNSINMDIKMLDNDKTYSMEKIANGGISTFTLYYSEIKFKCTKIDYHEKTGRIKYMLFEQITQ